MGKVVDASTRPRDAHRARIARGIGQLEISHRKRLPTFDDRDSAGGSDSARSACDSGEQNDVRNRNPKVRVNQSDNRERRFLKPSPPPCLTFFYRPANLCPALQPIRVKGGDVGVGAGRSQENAHRARSGLTRGVVISNAAAL